MLRAFSSRRRGVFVSPAEQPAAFIRDRLLAFFGAAHLMGAS